jgi:hypothetical protein
MAVGIGVAALVAGRPLRESLVAGAAVLVVQAVLGILNDAGDRERDVASGARGNPVAEDRIPSGNATFAATCLAILAIPLALQNGTVAGLALLLTPGLRVPLREGASSYAALVAAVGDQLRAAAGVPVVRRVGRRRARRPAHARG